MTNVTKEKIILKKLETYYFLIITQKLLFIYQNSVVIHTNQTNLEDNFKYQTVERANYSNCTKNVY